MANWEVISGTVVGSLTSPGGRIGEEVPTEVVNLTITNIVNGVHNGYSIAASNFKVGGGVESGTGTGVWLPFGGVIWDAHDSIDQVAFTDNGVAGDASNTVNVAVTLKAFTPTETSTFSAGIIENTSNPVTLSSAATRDLSLQTRWDYSANQTVTQSSLLSSVTSSDVFVGGVSEQVRKKLSGSVQGDKTTRIATVTFTASAGYFYNGVSASSIGFSYPAEAKSGTYEGSYSNTVEYTRENNLVTGFVVTILYAPPPLLKSDTASVISGLGHSINIPHNLTLIPTAAVETITNVSYPSVADAIGGRQKIRVFGTAGATYSIYIQKKTSLTSITTETSGGHYNFASRSFQNTAPVSDYTVGDKGVTTHDLVFPENTTSTRYDLIVSGLTSTGESTALASTVPKVVGDATIIQYGVATLTIKPITHSSNFDTMPADVVVKRPILFSGSSYIPASGFIVKSAASTNGTTTRLVLATPTSRIIKGMHVTGSGIAHGSTVSNIVGKIITLSAAATVASGTVLAFGSNTSNLVPFAFAINKHATITRIAPTVGADSPAAVAGLDKFSVAVGSSGVNTRTHTLASTKGIVPGMSVTGTSVNTNATAGLTVSSITNGTVVVLSDTQTLLEEAVLTFSNGNATSSTKLHSIDVAQGGTTSVVNVTGYINVGDLLVSSEVRVYIDNIITATP